MTDCISTIREALQLITLARFAHGDDAVNEMLRLATRAMSDLDELEAENTRLRVACQAALPILYWTNSHGGRCDEVINQLRAALGEP